MMSTGLGEVILYRAADGGPELDVRLDKNSVWLDAHQMAELFGRDRTVIVRHIRNVYTTGELQRDSTCAKNAQVATDGKVRQMDIYNLDMIISVGYRVNSLRGTQFRIWATNVLRQHLVQGYTVHERRLKELNQAVRLIAAPGSPPRNHKSHIFCVCLNCDVACNTPNQRSTGGTHDHAQ